MEPWALTLQWADVPQAALGLGFWLLPGMAAAWRWMPGGRERLAWAPLWSVATFALAAILLDTLFRVPVTLPFTIGIGIASTLLLQGQPLLERLRRGMQRRRRSNHHVSRGSRLALPFRWSLIAIVLAAVFLTASAPHLTPVEGEPDNAWGILLKRAPTLWGASAHPFPVHVDEDAHMASTAAMGRQGHVAISDPYTGRAPDQGLLSVEGFRRERGYHLATLQVSELTGLSLPFLLRFVPAAWASFLALAVYLACRPAPGALAGAFFVAALHSTIRFLGTAYYVPSAFALPWILAVVVACQRGEGPRRLAAILLLVTSAFFLHILLGAVVFVAGLCASLMQPAPWSERASVAGTTLLPLLWILPAAGDELARGALEEGSLPFSTEIFAVPGTLLWALTAIGVASILALPWLRGRRARPAMGTRRVAGGIQDGPGGHTAPHAALLALGCIMASSIAASVAMDHHSDATYARLVHATILCAMVLAGLGLGMVGKGIQAAWTRTLGRRRLGAWVSGCAMALVAVVALLPPVGAHLHEPGYGLMDDGRPLWDAQTWSAHAALSRAGIAPGDTFLSQPWRAPAYSATTGALPWSYLLPGAPLVHGDDWGDYLASNGADAAWLHARGITWVVAPLPPHAPHVQVGPGVYRILP